MTAGTIGIDGMRGLDGIIGAVIFGIFPMAGADGMILFGIHFGDITGAGMQVGVGTHGAGTAGDGVADSTVVAGTNLMEAITIHLFMW